MRGLPPAERRPGPALDLALLLAVTLLFGLAGGTPYFHPDEVLDEAMTALTNHGDPEYFHYPGLVIYAYAALYGTLLLLARAFGLARSLDQLAGLFGRTPATGCPVLTFQSPGHLLTVLFSFLGVAAAYLAVRRLTGKRALSLMAGVLVATSLIWVRNNHYLTVDIPLAALCMGTALLALRFFRNPGGPDGRQAAALGVMIGLAASAKYNGALVGVSIVFPMLVLGWRKPGILLARLAICGAAALLIFSATNPFIFVDFRLFLEHFASRVEEMHEGRPGFFMSNGWLFHLSHSLWQGYGMAPLCLAAIGAAWLACTKRVAAAEKLVLLLFPLVFYLVMGRSKAAFVRHILPVVPFLGVFSALGFRWIWEQVCRATSTRLLRGITAALLIACPLPNALLSLRHNALLGKCDTRREMETILRGMKVSWNELTLYTGRYLKRSVDRSGIQPAEYRFSTYSLRSANDPIHYVRRAQPDLMILDSFSHDRLLRRTRGRHPGAVEGLIVIEITPFNAPKAQVPLSPESVYSPFLPDLVFRDRAGPYIEIYCHEPELAAAVRKACAKAGVPCVVAPGLRGFYYRRLLASYLQGQ
ncbi:MAG: glycosyltransferase family 39 protein [Verrucomicrobia bacterium]|nr:glycosyltransferase family 39 protein [Verrucomicrobiota bacterium]MBU1910590.1 glycosyltransferase family 39 protein [Verrucomicrobiota bacterium]